jgi:hypothetical protein
LKLNKVIRIIAVLLAVMFCSAAASKKNDIPRFNQYPASGAYKGKAATVILATEDERMFRTRLREASTWPANFAGDYVLTSWGCGMSCIMAGVVSRKTGRVYFVPGNICCWAEEQSPIEFYPNSRLIVLSGFINEQGARGVHYYEFTGKTFKHLKTIPVERKQ